MLITGNSKGTDLLMYLTIIMQCKLAGTPGNREVYMSKDHGRATVSHTRGSTVNDLSRSGLLSASYKN